MTEQKEEKSCPVYKHAYFYGLGGAVATIRSVLTTPLTGVTPTLSSLHQNFVSSGVQNVIFEEIDGKVKEKMEEFNNPQEAWKIGVTAGVAIGTVNALVDSVFTNVYKHHAKRKEENPDVRCTFTSAVDLVSNKGITSLFDGYFSRAFSKSLFISTFKTSLWMNSKWIGNVFPNSTCPIKTRVIKPFIFGTVSGVQATLISKPIDQIVKGMFSKEKIQPKKIVKNSICAAKVAGPSLGLTVALYSNGVKYLKPSEIALKKLMTKFHK
ncbi:tricarboxylate transport protein [Anaeramoeba flamelloides]|uniref:Tricarboxylate transport protein n=1 Tax=Anaeramoeba flamelloides TaxID=1746091 RepID=A0AAV8ADU3_9EUKA|nr:tricarboxylate transport protein [Anaeramoeba flamelloides]KAJ6249607.1 tricarboxylate transport protein [Anaeramoeba flamelloides]